MAERDRRAFLKAGVSGFVGVVAGVSTAKVLDNRLQNYDEEIRLLRIHDEQPENADFITPDNIFIHLENNHPEIVKINPDSFVETIHAVASHIDMSPEISSFLTTQHIQITVPQDINRYDSEITYISLSDELFPTLQIPATHILHKYIQRPKQANLVASHIESQRSILRATLDLIGDAKGDNIHQSENNIISSASGSFAGLSTSAIVYEALTEDIPRRRVIRLAGEVFAITTLTSVALATGILKKNIDENNIYNPIINDLMRKQEIIELRGSYFTLPNE